MVDVVPGFETVDASGTTAHFNGTVTTSPANVPSSAGNVIAELLIHNTSTLPTVNLLVSFDGGTTFKTIKPDGVLIWSPKGGLKQIRIKSSTGTASYEIIMNREES